MSMTSRFPCPRCGADVSADWTHCASCGQPQSERDDPPEAWIGRTVDGKYAIESVLGVGGMGMVFQARRMMVGDTVALKVLFPRFLESPLQRRLFAAEAVASARLTHPHVVHVFDADRDADGVAYLAMEVLVGRTFREVLKDEAPMQAAPLIPVMVQVCRGLEAAHEAHVIHRDLKPDNIFMQAQPDGTTRVKLVDFGIAAMLDADAHDEARKLLGTLRYMSPEQCRGEAIDARSDLYSLGVIMYEALTRRRATGKTLSAVIHDAVQPPNLVLPNDQQIPHALEDLVLRLLAKDPAERPPSARAVGDALEAILTGLSAPRAPAPATPTQPVDSTPLSKSFLWVGLALAILLGVVAGILWGQLGEP
ncbi:MAG: protein kinase [Myxococcales bacterium]|nr:protein kinase [Myxococcales bacterium]